MLRIVLLSALAALGAAQSYNSDPKTAAILAEQRYLQTDGRFGAAYKQEDGVEFKEESDADGTRHGSYSYVDPTGQRRTVSYTAGKNGFQASGDHLPAAPAPVTRPDPQYNSPVQQPQQAYRGPVSEDNGDWVDDTRQWNNGPAPVNNAQWNNQASQQTWTNPQTYAPPKPQWNSNPAPQPQQQWNSNPAPQPQQQWNSAPQTQQWTAPAYNQPAPQRWSAPLETTPAPHRFYPPGKLSLNRSPDGFSYTFNKA